MVAKIIKVVLNLVLILLCLISVFHGVSEFNAAKNWLEIFRGAFWFILGWVAVFVLIENIKKNRWPIW